jgi:hypothetical protein
MAIKQLVIVATAMLLNGIDLSTTTAQTHAISLDFIHELKLTNVKAEFVTFKDRQALRVTDAAVSDNEQHGYAMLPGVEFQDGVIEVDLAGEPGPGAEEFARGFVGIGFRMVPDGSRFECIYLRPTIGRAEGVNPVPLPKPAGCEFERRDARYRETGRLSLMGACLGRPQPRWWAIRREDWASASRS